MGIGSLVLYVGWVLQGCILHPGLSFANHWHCKVKHAHLSSYLGLLGGLWVIFVSV